MKGGILVVSLAMLLAGCTSVNKFTAPDGKSKMVSADCSDGKVWYPSWGKCMEAISKECPNGYTVIERNQNVYSSAGAFIGHGVANSHAGEVVERNIIVQCK